MAPHPPPRRLPILAVIFLAGVLVLELGFIASYVGALHEPTPHGVPVAVVGSASAVARIESELTAAGASQAVRPVAAKDVASARAEIDRGMVYAAIVPGAGSSQLLVANAANPFTAAAITAIFRGVATASSTRLTVRDVAPLPAGDAQGLSPFYLAVGWVVGGYLAATMLGLGSGMAAESRRAASGRVLGLGIFSAVSGLVGAVIVDLWLGALQHHFLELAAVGALLVFGTAIATAALETVLGIVGTAIAIAAFVVVGNPSSGGPFAAPLLPHFFSAVGGYLPPGAGTSLIRSVSYFGGAGIERDIVVLAIYAAAGIVVSIALAGPKRPLFRLLPE
ncbi:MAG: hypothetical protein JWO62_1782 [Acidimicrobiaceae bacterium]|jgi:hypothetical protein|nr:hypothetical protein [Acidimicrobiaceae bacterium]